MNRFFASGGEFAGIERMFPASCFASDGQGLGDDAFLWTPAPGETWVASTDSSVEGVHFRLDWMTRTEALHKALLSNLSDINAMGGRTRHALFALGAPAAFTETDFETVGLALRAWEERYGFRVVGGDTTRSHGAEFHTFTVLGVVGEGGALLRGAARPGQRIYVSGTLGGSAAGLELLRNPPRSSSAARGVAFDTLRRAHVSPAPPLALGPALSALQQHHRAGEPGYGIAAIDLSDGLSSELWHLARQSGCALTIDFDALPAHPALSQFPDAQARDFILHGGEEYQLVFTGAFTGAELAGLRALTPVTEIGMVSEGEGVYLTESGDTRALMAGGFTHT